MVKSGLSVLERKNTLPTHGVLAQDVNAWYTLFCCSALGVKLSGWLMQVDGDLAANSRPPVIQCKKVFTRKLVHDVGMGNFNFNFLFTKYEHQRRKFNYFKKRHLGDQTNININNINEEHVSKLKVQIPELVRNIFKTF